MPRVVWVYFPHPPTDRIRRHGEAAVPADQTLVVISKSGSKRWISAAATAAQTRPEARHAGKQGAGNRDRLADDRCRPCRRRCCIGETGAVAIQPGRCRQGGRRDSHGHRRRRSPAGRRGSSDVWPGQRIKGRALTARAAVANTWGAAHAITRLTSAGTTIVPVAGVAKAGTGLPIQGLRVMGAETVGELFAMPRAPLTLRYGRGFGRRQDCSLKSRGETP